MNRSALSSQREVLPQSTFPLQNVLPSRTVFPSQTVFASQAVSPSQNLFRVHKLLRAIRRLAARVLVQSQPPRPWLAVVVLSLAAITATEVGVELFYGTELFLGSGLVVLALLLLGDRGLWVGLAASLLVPRLWGEPMTLLIDLAELVWLKLYLDHVGDRYGRRDNGWIVLADILYWVLIGVPLAFLLFGVVLNQDPGSVLNLAIRQGVNGSVNAIIGFLIYIIIGFLRAFLGKALLPAAAPIAAGEPATLAHQGANHSTATEQTATGEQAATGLTILREQTVAQGQPMAAAEGVPLHGVVLILVLAAIVLPSLMALTFSTRQLNLTTLEINFRRMRQMALISASFRSALLPEFDAGLRRMGTLQEFRVVDADGKVVYSSNPGLFRTLETSYAPLPKHQTLWRTMPLKLNLLVPRESLASPQAALRGYWWATLKARRLATLEPAPLPAGQQVQVVQPARARIRDLEAQSAQALGTMSWIVLIGAFVAEAAAWALDHQLPPQVRTPWRDSQAQGDTPQTAPVARLLIRELEAWRQILQTSETARLRCERQLHRSEQQRLSLQREVDSLNIVDPLTGCFNRRELHRRLEYELQRSNRDQGDLSFICIEIDHLRQIVESYGSAIGDEVLRCVAAEICRRSRTTDCVCRFTEDRFALLLPFCSAAAAQRVAQLLLQAVAQQEVAHQGCRLSVTLSVGISTWRRGDDDGDSMINRAEHALYRAKIEGRNRAVSV